MVALSRKKRQVAWAKFRRHGPDLGAATLVFWLLLAAFGAALAQPQYQPWQFRPMDQNNARGAPPWQPAPYQAAPPGAQAPAASAPASGQTQPEQIQPGSYPAVPWSPGQPPQTQWPQAQWPPAQYPQAQVPPGQPPAGYAQQPFGAPGPGQYTGTQVPTGQYPNAQYPTGQLPSRQSPGGQYPSSQYPSSQYQGGQYQGGQFAPPQYSQYGQPRGMATAGPRLEVQLTEDRPYVQQNVLVRLRVISSGNLATASPDLTAIDEVLFEKVEGPKTSTRGSGNSRDIVNEFVMAMTPLRDGDLEVGPIKVTGTLAGGVPFEAVAAEPLRLQVRPPMAAVRPWLPLQSLQIKADLDSTGEVERGRPVTLTLELEAQGATGDQLPSLESMLRSDDFRVYREQTMTDTRLASNGSTLIGKRIEYFTLVPHRGGRLQLPELRLGWWNVDTASREASSVPIRTFSVTGESGPFGFSRKAAHDDDDWRVFWLPLAGVLLLLIGYWGGVWLRGQTSTDGERERASGSAAMLPRLRSRLARAAAGAGVSTGRALTAAARLLNPTPLLRRTGALLAGLKPRSARVYQCARAADSAVDPAAWCLAFQQQACRNLQAQAREPLPRMADRIVDLRPGADREHVLRLMQQLDSALYNRQDIDFVRWKRDFRQALRPATGTLRSLVAARVRQAHLPALNPQPQRY